MANLKHLLTSTPNQMIFLSQWLEEQDISIKSIFDHKKYGWIESLGRGAYIRKGTKPEILAGVSAICTQTTFKVHLGGMYALDQFHGIRQYIRTGLQPQVFTSEKKPLPSWFVSTFENSYDLIKTSFLDNETGLEEHDYLGLKIKVSSVERALLEALFIGDISTNEVFQLFEFITVLNIKLMNELLQKCKSIRVKRLFLYLAKQTGYSWYEKVDQESIDLGTGVREIDKTGSYNKEFNIVVDKISEV